MEDEAKQTLEDADPICIDDIIAASVRIRDHIHRTLIMTNSTIDDLASTARDKRRILFKCEHLQKIGAFKIRGATNALLQLNNEQLQRGVVTHSSGNHAQALALAARQLGIPAFVVMPENSPDVKKNAVRGYGAEVTECKATLEARESTCERIISETGVTFIHPYNDPRVMAGQGTQMLELLEQAAEMGHPLDAVLIPCGGGGMLGGCATAARALSPETLVFGAEPELANDAQISLQEKKMMPALPPTSCADGLLTCLGTNTFRMITKNVDAIFTVTEEQIIRAMRLVWERMKQVIEPSAAVGLAVALYNQDFRALDNIATIGVILCGGNVQLDRAMALFAKLDNAIPDSIVLPRKTQAPLEPRDPEKRVILLKTKSVPNDPYEAIFMENGYNPVFVPVLDHAMVNSEALFETCNHSPATTFSGLIVTSQRSVEAIGTTLPRLTDASDLLNMPIYTVGPATCQAIRNLGFTNVLGSDSGNGDALASFILDTRALDESRPLFFVVGDKRRDIITKRMKSANVELHELVVYETVTASTFPKDFAAATGASAAETLVVEWIVFFSPAGADVALSYIKQHQTSTRIATIGPTTQEYLVQQWGIQPAVVSSKPDAASLYESLLHFAK